jgi:hypothetical protein
MVAEVLSTLEVADCCQLMPFPELLIRFDVVRSVAAEDSVALVGLWGVWFGG